MSEYDKLEQHHPMPPTLIDVLEKVREGCEMHMNQLDNDGYCAESDEYVVALAFFDDYMEKLKTNNTEAKSFPIGNDAEFGTSME